MKIKKTYLLYLTLILFLMPASASFAGRMIPAESDTLYFTSFPAEGKHYRVSVIFLNEKTIEVKTELKDSTGVILQSRSMKAKRYPVKENEAAPVLFDAEIFTAGYHCPVMIYIERLSRLQLYIDDAGCYAGEQFLPSMFGTLTRSN